MSFWAVGPDFLFCFSLLSHAFRVLSRASFNELRLLNVMGPQGLAWKWCIGSELSFLVIQVGFFHASAS